MEDGTKTSRKSSGQLPNLSFQVSNRSDRLSARSVGVLLHLPPTRFSSASDECLWTGTVVVLVPPLSLSLCLPLLFAGTNEKRFDRVFVFWENSSRVLGVRYLCPLIAI